MILSRYKDPLVASNSVWSPSSVPAVRAQNWSENYVDKNIADNPVHPTVADLLIAPERCVGCVYAASLRCLLGIVTVWPSLGSVHCTAWNTALC